MTKRCDRCSGSGKIVGMGSMKEKCTACDGVGMIEVKEVKKKRKA